MLDVMKTPPPVIEQITWTASRVQMPDDAETVLMFCPGADVDDPVFEGWFDSANDQWLNIEGFPVGMVTWWAKKPMGPDEPKPGQVQDVRKLVECGLEHVASMVYGSDGMPSSVRRHDLSSVVRLTLRGLGMRCLSANTLSIDLANGHSLMVQVRKHGEVTTQTAEAGAGQGAGVAHG